MALVIPPRHYQCLIPIKHDRVTRSAAITFGIRVPETRNNPTEIADDVLVAFSAGFQTVMDNECEYGPVVVTFDQGDLGRGSISGTASARGGRSGVSITSNTALLLRKVTARIGRPGRGRMFVPWVLAENVVDEVGALSNTALDDSNNRAEAFLDSLATEEFEMVILHDESVLSADVPSLVTSLIADPVAGTQRRRMRF